MPRIRPMADAARQHADAAQLGRLGLASTGAAATWVAGIRSAATVPTAYDDHGDGRARPATRRCA